VRITDVSLKQQSVKIPLAASEEFETTVAGDPVFQFSPEFHRVPSPIFNTPHITFLPNPEDQRSNSLIVNEAQDPSRVRGPSPGPSTVAPSDISLEVSSDKDEFSNTAQQSSGGSRSNIVSARAKFFEQEIQQHQQPTKSAIGKAFNRYYQKRL
jgi:hypothetical protein